jgi:tetratricopeptide (TPR) repeat protein
LPGEAAASQLCQPASGGEDHTDAERKREFEEHYRRIIDSGNQGLAAQGSDLERLIAECDQAIAACERIAPLGIAYHESDPEVLRATKIECLGEASTPEPLDPAPGDDGVMLAKYCNANLVSPELAALAMSGQGMVDGLGYGRCLSLYLRGRQAGLRGDHRDAVRHYKGALRYRNNAVVQHALAVACTELGQKAEAERALKATIELNADGPLGELAQGQLEELRAGTYDKQFRGSWKIVALLAILCIVSISTIAHGNSAGVATLLICGSALALYFRFKTT